MIRDFPRRVWLLPIPILTGATMGMLQALRGPFSMLNNADPAYPYLFGMLNLVNGRSLTYTDHPGTPVQIFGAALLELSRDIGDAGALTRNVLADPEHHLWVIAVGFLLILCLSLVALGHAVLVASGRLSIAMLAQTGPLLNTHILSGETPLVSPEPMLMSASLLFATALVHLLSAERPALEKRDLALLGISAALGITTKITFAPLLLIIPIVLFRHWRAAIFCVSTFIAAALILLSPAFSRLGTMSRWISNIFWGSGRLGSGEPTVIDPGIYLQSLKLMLADNWQAYSLALIAVLALATALFKKSKPRSPQVVLLSLLLLILLGVSLMAAKSYEPRYLNAGLVLSGSLVAVTTWLCIEDTRTKGLDRLAIRAAVALVIVLVLLTSYQALSRARDDYKASRTATRLTDILAAEHAGCRIAPYYLSGDPLYALKLGFDYARRDIFATALRKQYGDRLFFDIWLAEFQSWTTSHALQSTVEREPCLIFRGTPRDAFAKDERLSRLITDECRIGKEALYLTKGACRPILRRLGIEH